MVPPLSTSGLQRIGRAASKRPECTSSPATGTTRGRRSGRPTRYLDALNAKLRDTLNEARELSLDAPSAKAVQAKLGGAGGSLTDYFQQFIDRLDAKGKLWEYRKYKVTLGKLQDCLGTELLWREVDRDALTKFERYLREKRQNNPNTLRKEAHASPTDLQGGDTRGCDRAIGRPLSLVYQKPKGRRLSAGSSRQRRSPSSKAPAQPMGSRPALSTRRSAMRSCSATTRRACASAMWRG